MTLGAPPQRVAFLTDFGPGPYLGQMVLRLGAEAPGVTAVDLISDLAPFRPDLAAYLLPALTAGMPPRTLYCAVVDPGVGGERAVLAARSGEDWILAPDNGLLVPLLRQRPEASVWRIDWRPPAISASFHGRDLFVPLAAALCAGSLPAGVPLEREALAGAQWPADWAGVCYADAFGNLMTGLRATGLGTDRWVQAGGRLLPRARTFCEVEPGTAFWYRNALGLVELAVNQGSAAAVLGLGPGERITLA